MTALLPPNLPDARTAERLLDVLDTLERSLRHPRTAAAPAAALQALQTENNMLKGRQAAAKIRLEALLARIQVAAQEAATQSPAA